MSARTRLKPGNMIARLFLTVAGVFLMLGPPFAFQMLRLASRFENAFIAAVELPCLVVGFVLLYLAIKE